MCIMVSREKSEVRVVKGTVCLKVVYKPQRGHLGMYQKPGKWRTDWETKQKLSWLETSGSE